MNEQPRLVERDGGEDLSPGQDLARLFHEHNASLVQLLRARLRSSQEAQDVAQEAYVRLLQLDRLGAISYLRTYLFRTAFNIATDRLRNAAMRSAAHRDPVFDFRTNELSPEASAAAGEELDAVEKALAGLPPRERYAYLLYRFTDLDIGGVARRLNITERSVRNYVARALLCCRAALDRLRDPSNGDGQGGHT